MSRALAADVAKSVENVVRQLNRQHEDTFCFWRGAPPVLSARSMRNWRRSTGDEIASHTRPGRHVY
jgi:hypothetical protein